MSSLSANNTPSFASIEKQVVTIAPLAKRIDELLELAGPLESRAFWQHPAWWQLANQHFFNNELELAIVHSTEEQLIAAIPVLRDGGLLRSPQHPHLTVGDSLWRVDVTASVVNDSMDALLDALSAWGWQSANTPDSSELRQCQNTANWQWRQSRESACFDTTGELPISGKLRRNLARHERNLQNDQTLSYRISSVDEPEALAAALQEFLLLEASGWKGESGTAIIKDPTLKGFYEGMLSFTDKNCALEIHHLHLDSQCVASQLAFLCGTTRYLLKIAYDEQYAAHSPGSLLLWHTLKHSMDDATLSLSLVSAPDWASRWKPLKTPVWHVTRYSNDVNGAIRKKAHSLRTGITNQLRKTCNRSKS